MADPIKRVHYFDHQFLHADDFIDEQEYHIRLRRLHNAALHTWGIARGLDLSFKIGESRATVSEGVAVDVDGREIVLANSSPTPDLSGYKNKTVYITIAYSEKEDDSTTETGVSGETRMTEEPEIRVAEDPPVDPSQELILGRLKLDENAKITLKDEGEERDKRRLAGVIGGDLEARSLRLSLPDAAPSQWPALSCSAANQVDLTGDLAVIGNVGIGTQGLPSLLSVSGGAVFGSGYADKKAPDKGLLVEGNVGIGTDEPVATLDVAGVVRAQTFASTNPLRHRMYPENPLVYQDIFDAVKRKAIAKLGQPHYDEKTWDSKNPWCDRTIIQFGGNNEEDGNGAEITMPADYDTVWVRVLGDRWTVVKAYFLDGDREDLGLWAGGWRAANCYCPDGTLSDGYREQHQWLPIPVGRAGRLALIAKTQTDNNFWLSGVAFSKNPWAHTVQSAVGYHWALNGGNGTAWEQDWQKWNYDVLSGIDGKTNLELRVPVVPSGRDKLLYLIEHNNNWNGCMHSGITVNDQRIERFMATYDNPFARHWNSKWYNRYIAARIPADLVPTNARWLSVRIDMSKQNARMHFREIGTHDLDIPTHY